MSEYNVFKFRSVNKNLLRSLVEGSIYFARPSSLNDPFDCRVDVLRTLENAVAKCHAASRSNLRKLQEMQGFLEKVQSDLQGFGVCSFSLELLNPIMWAHYADGHRGLSLMYSFPEAYFYDNADRILGIAQVQYGVNPLMDWFIQRAPNLGSFQEFGTSLITKILTVKSTEWEYEKEVRILRRSPGVEELDRDNLKQVCFGLETPDDDIDLVKKIINRGNYDVALCRMKRCNDSDFGLKPEEI